MNVDRLRQKLNKKFEGSVLSAGDLAALSHILYGVSCCLSLDLAIGRPGLPSGRLTEIVGLESAGKCLVGDTLIDCPRDLSEYPDGVPIKDLVGCKDFYTYSYSRKQKRFVLRRVLWVKKTRIRAKVMRMVWYDARKDSYGEVIGTPDHKILLYSGEYKQLKDLRSGDSLRPFNRGYHRRKPYADITVAPQEHISEHKFIYEQLYGLTPEGYLVHHENGNKFDNDPDNLVMMSKSEHIIHHHTGSVRSLVSKRKMAEAQKKSFQRRRDAGIELPKPMLGKKLSAETRKKISDKLSTNHPRGMLGKHHTEEARAKISEASKNQIVTDEKREKNRKVAHNYWDNLSQEEYERRCAQARRPSKMRGKHQSPEHLKNRIEAMRLSREARKKSQGDSDNHKVVSVEFYGYEDVYDMEVEGTHNFVANEIVVHNSAHAYSVLAECQRLGGYGVLLEAEQGFEIQRLQQLGVKTDELMLCQPKNLEGAFAMIEESIIGIRKDEKFTGPVAIVLDSIAGLPSEAEDEGNYDDHHMGLSARVVSQGLRKLMWTVAEHKVVLVFLNQLRKTMDRYDPAGQYVSYGGMAIGYRATLRMRVRSRKSDVVMQGKKPVGVWDNTDFFKNKIGVPFKTAKYFFNYEKGIDVVEDLWQSGLTIGLLKVAGGGFFKLSDGKTRIKRDQWEDFITTKFKSVENAKKFMTQQAVQKGFLKLYE